MFYSLRRRDGSMDPLSGGTWVAPDGKVRRLGSGEVTIRVQGRWTSPRGGRYPARWRLEVPSLGLAVNLRPVLADQELVGRPRYWEGAVDVSGTSHGGNISGEGYVELVGYARAP
jgi:predicted secreted hydrolase